MFRFINDIIRLFKHEKHKNKSHDIFKSDPRPQPQPKEHVKKSFSPMEDEVIVDKETASFSPHMIKATMTIYYVDEDGHYIHEYDTINGYVGQPVNFVIPNFEHYVLFKIYGNSTYMIKESNKVILQYNKLNGKPVNIFFINYDTYSMIRLPQMVLGQYNNEFNINIPELKGFNLINYSGNTSGIFNDQIKHLVVYYRRNDWQDVQQNIFYIKLREYTRVYDDTDGSILHVLLPKNSIWKVFYQVTTDKALWLNIGPNQWIIDRNFNRMHYPFAKTLTNTDSWKIKNVEYPASIINDENRSISVYNFPYGSCIGFLHNGNSFLVTQEIIDQNNKNWLEINNLHYISDESIKKWD